MLYPSAQVPLRGNIVRSDMSDVLMCSRADQAFFRHLYPCHLHGIIGPFHVRVSVSAARPRVQRCRYDSYSVPPPTLSRLPCSVRSKRFCSLLLHRFATMFWSFAIAGRLLFGGDLDQFSGAPARLLSSAWKRHTSSYTHCIENESCLTHARGRRSLFLLRIRGSCGVHDVHHAAG